MQNASKASRVTIKILLRMAGDTSKLAFAIVIQLVADGGHKIRVRS